MPEVDGYRPDDEEILRFAKELLGRNAKEQMGRDSEEAEEDAQQWRTRLEAQIAELEIRAREHVKRAPKYHRPQHDQGTEQILEALEHTAQDPAMPHVDIPPTHTTADTEIVEMTPTEMTPTEMTPTEMTPAEVNSPDAELAPYTGTWEDRYGSGGPLNTRSPQDLRDFEEEEFLEHHTPEVDPEELKGRIEEATKLLDRHAVSDEDVLPPEEYPA